MDLDLVLLAFRSERELRFRVMGTTMYPEYRPYELVFVEPRSFSGSDDMSHVRLCVRGPSPAGDGVVFEFESQEIVPTEGRPLQVEVSGSAEPRVLFGKTISAVEARIVAAGVTVEAVRE